MWILAIAQALLPRQRKVESLGERWALAQPVGFGPTLRGGSLKGVKVPHHQVNRGDAVLGRLLAVARVAATKKDPSVNLRVQRFDAPAEHLRPAGQLRHIAGLQPCLAKYLRRTASGNDLDTQRCQPARELQQASFVIHADQCSLDGHARLRRSRKGAYSICTRWISKGAFRKLGGGRFGKTFPGCVRGGCSWGFVFVLFFALRVSPFARRLSLPYFFTRAFSRTCPPSSATTYSSCSEPSPVFSCCVFRRRNSRKFCCVSRSVLSPALSLALRKARNSCSTFSGSLSGSEQVTAKSVPGFGPAAPSTGRPPVRWASMALAATPKWRDTVPSSFCLNRLRKTSRYFA